MAAHIFFFLFWILVNTLHLPPIPRFDPLPFSLLGTAVADNIDSYKQATQSLRTTSARGLEAILLAIFILMRQARLARRADEREHLMLQVFLLTEKEVTAVISMNQQIAIKVGLRNMENGKEIEQLGGNTSIDEVAEDIQRSLSEDL